MPRDDGLKDVRVYASNPNVRGVVIVDTGAPTVLVRWDDGDETWSRRDLLNLVWEWSAR